MARQSFATAGVMLRYGESVGANCCLTEGTLPQAQVVCLQCEGTTNPEHNVNVES